MIPVENPFGIRGALESGDPRYESQDIEDGTARLSGDSDGL